MKKRFFNYCGDAFTTGCDIKTLIGYFMVVYMIKPWVMVLYASMLGLAFFTPRLGALLFLITIVSLLLQAYGDAYEHLKKSAKNSNYLLERHTVFKRTKMFAILQKSILSPWVVYQPDLTLEEKQTLADYAWASNDNMMMLYYISYLKEGVHPMRTYPGYIACWDRHFAHLQHDDYDAIKNKLLALVGMPEDAIPITSIPHESTLGCDMRVVECLLQVRYTDVRDILLGIDYKC